MIIILNSLLEKYWKITHVWIIDYSSSAGKESTCNTGDLSSIPGLGKSPGEEISYPLQHSWASLVAQMESACNVGNLGLIPGLGRSPGERNGYPLQNSGLENSMDKGASQATVRGFTKSRTRLSNFKFIYLKWLKIYWIKRLQSDK